MTATVLVAGVPRSGSTWTASVLAAAPDACLVAEPDNSYAHPYALHVKRALGQYPCLSSDDVHPPFSKLWRHAVDRSGRRARSAGERIRNRVATRLLRSMHPTELDGVLHGRVTPRARMAMLLGTPVRPSAPRVVVKTVHGSLALEWIAKQTGAAIVLLQRNPAAVVASWLKMNWTSQDGWRIPRRVATDVIDTGVAVPADGDTLSPLEWITWNMCTVLARQQALALAHPEWHTVDHEVLCTDPGTQFRSLADNLGWEWHPAIEAFIEQSNRPGMGYDIGRLAGDAASSWRHELDTQQIATITAIQERFPLLRRWL